MQRPKAAAMRRGVLLCGSRLLGELGDESACYGVSVSMCWAGPGRKGVGVPLISVGLAPPSYQDSTIYNSAELRIMKRLQSPSN